MIGRSVLIVGNGVAGPALAHWLLQYGFQPTIVERAPGPVSSGYTVDLWGKAYDLLERMGLLPQLHAASLPLREVRAVAANGKRRAAFDGGLFAEVTRGRHVRLQRSALSAILYGAVAPNIRTVWEDEPIFCEQRAQGVWVKFRRAEPELFNVVIGADGLHSAVRRQIFGEPPRFERFLGFSVAAFEAVGYPKRNEGVYVSFNAPGKHVARVTLPDDRTTFLIAIADQSAPEPHWNQDAAKHYLRTQLAECGWEVPLILDTLDRTDSVYFERTSQVRMPRWSRGAVALLGDAAYAPSLLAGQGAALGIIGAYVLAGELSRSVVAEGAFDRYESILRLFIHGKQDVALKRAESFLPRSRLGVWLRNLSMKRFAIPAVARSALRGQLKDELTLPDYTGHVRAATVTP